MPERHKLTFELANKIIMLSAGTADKLPNVDAAVRLDVSRRIQIN